jgi:hypothetical protein
VCVYEGHSWLTRSSQAVRCGPVLSVTTAVTELQRMDGAGFER